MSGGDLETQFQQTLNHIFAWGGDFLSFIILAAIVLAFCVYFGRDRFAPLIAGLYAALAIYSAFPYSFDFMQGPLVRIAFFIILAALGFVAFSGLSYFMARASGEFFSSVILSVLTAGFLLSISMHVLPVQDLYHFSDATKSLFASNQAFFWWLIAPLGGIFFFSR